MRHGRWIAPLLGAALVLGAAVPAGAKAKPTPADRVILQAGLVTAADVPAGWTTTAQADTGAGEFQSIAVCKAIYAAVRVARATVPYRLSPVFSPPGATNGLTVVDDTVLRFKTPAAAGAFLGRFQTSAAGPCLQAVLAKGLSGQGHAVVVPLTNLAGVGDAVAGYEATITGTGPGLPAPAVGDITVVRVGRVIVYASSLNEAVSLPQGPGIVQAVVGRLRGAGA